jgi:undecaprenyl-diphosphatase
MDEWLVAVLLGVLQGVLEWLPISSEGSIALVVTAMGAAPTVSTQLGLFLHVGTALAALTYYRERIVAVLRGVPSWRPQDAFGPERATLSFLGIATAASFLTGGAAYFTIEEVASALSGGAFVSLIGALLVLTGVVQYVADEEALSRRETPTLVDALLVGSLQGVAVLPGVSRSGTTVSALLLRGHSGERSLDLSFMLSIPAGFGAGAIVLLDVGVPSISPTAGLLAVATSALVGYFTVGALVALVERVAFWGVCVGFGALAVVGGLLVVL